MKLFQLLIPFGVTVVSIIGYVLSVGYRRRSHVNELRKQGVVSLELAKTNKWPCVSVDDTVVLMRLFA
jgi:orotate phosphoribosyltransferase-like protein